MAVIGTPSTFTRGTIGRLVSVPICPDGLTLADLGEADNARGRTIRLFFYILRWWPA